MYDLEGDNMLCKTCGEEYIKNKPLSYTYRGKLTIIEQLAGCCDSCGGKYNQILKTLYSLANDVLRHNNELGEHNEH